MLAAATGEARTIRWVAMGDALTLDPHATSDAGTQALNRQIYDTLVTRGPKGELVGELAASWRTLAFDAQSWEFRLRPGVNSTTAPRSPPTTSCSRCSGRWRRPRI